MTALASDWGWVVRVGESWRELVCWEMEMDVDGPIFRAFLSVLCIRMRVPLPDEESDKILTDLVELLREREWRRWSLVGRYRNFNVIRIWVSSACG